jgi:hypothetical protein
MKMTGSYMKLMVKGLQDEYLTANGKYNFFVKSYENSIDFAVEQIRLDFIENVDFGKKITLTFPKRADLLHQINFCFSLPSLQTTSGTYASWTNSIGHGIIDYIDLEIGTKLISRYTGLYMSIMEELTSNTPYENFLIGKHGNTETSEASASDPSDYVVKLPFWFCKEIHTAFPLVCLDYHQIKITIKLRPFLECVIYDGSTPPLPVRMGDSYIISDFIFLDEALVTKVKSKPQQILVEQVQYNDGDDAVNNSGSFKTDIRFNHPIKELLWVFREEDSTDNNDWFNFSKRNLIPYTKVFPLMKTARLSVDGKDYTENKNEIIFRTLNNHKSKTDKHIYTIPFCLNPEDWSPSGSLNFSKLDSVVLYGEMNTPTPANRLHMFGINYNWMTIKSGISNLEFIS